MFNTTNNEAKINNIPKNIIRKQSDSLFFRTRKSSIKAERIFSPTPYIEFYNFIGGKEVRNNQQIEVISINHTFDDELIIEYCFKGEYEVSR